MSEISLSAAWINTKLGDVCVLITDGTHYSPRDTGGPYPFITVADMSEKGLDFRGASHISPQEYQKALHTGSCPHIGDVLFSKDGTVGKVHVVDTSSPFAVLSSIAILRPNSEILDSEFLKYILLHPGTLKEASDRKTGSALRRIILRDIKQIPVSIPSLPVQKSIASILAKADRLRRLRRYALQLSDTFLHSVFLQMFGDLSTIPRDWKISKLGSIADIPSGVTKGRDFRGKKTMKVPYLRVANVQDGFLDLTEVKLIEALPTDVDRLRLEPGDILMTEGGDYDKLGRGTVWEGQIDPCIHQNHIFRVRFDSAQVLPRYFAQIILTPYAKRYFLRASKQTTNLATINKTQLKNFPVPIPPLDSQTEFVELVDYNRQVRAKQKEAIRQAYHLFDTLLYWAFRGEL